jgi:hypothetical protein
MALPNGGELSINAIRNELNVSTGSLRDLSALAGKSTPDSISEFYNYQLPPAIINYNQNTGQLYDGCSMSMDSYGQLEGQDVGGYYFGPYGGGGNLGYNITNSERGTNNGTFLTFGGYGTIYARGRSTVTVTAYTNGYGACPCQPIYSFINMNGVRRANTNTTCGFTAISYSFTVEPGTTYTVEFGVWYGSV